jgi:RNA polymerase sigma-70 factor (sigma-E family)
LTLDVNLDRAVVRARGVVIVAPGCELPGVDVRAGREAFEYAFATLYRDAYRVAYRLCGSQEDAADLAQEALVRAYGRWTKVSVYEEPSAWVARVVTNLAFDQWRRRRLLRRFRAPSPAAEGTDDHVELHDALESLSRRQRQVVVLRYLADQSEAVTAEVLGCSVGTVKQHASRGLAALRAQLSKPPEEVADV